MISEKNKEVLEDLELESRSLFQDAKIRFFKNKAAVFSLIVMSSLTSFIKLVISFNYTVLLNFASSTYFYCIDELFFFILLFSPNFWSMELSGNLT